MNRYAMDVQSAAASPAADLEKLYSRLTWKFVPFLMLCFLAAYLDRINVGFAKLGMMNDLGLSDAVYGFGAGIFFLGYFIFEVPSNMMLAHFGARRWISRIMISWGVVSCGMIFVKDPVSFYVLRFFLGLAEAGFLPGVILYLTYWFPAARRGRTMGIFYTALALAGVVGGPLSGAIMHYMSDAGALHAWQWLFVIESLPSILLGVIALFYLDDSIDHARWLSADEKKTLKTELAKDDKLKVDIPLVKLLLHPRIWHFTLIFFALNLANYGLSFWMPSIIRSLGVADTFQIGLITTLPNLCAIAMMLYLTARADLTQQRRLYIGIALILGAAGLGLSVLLNGNASASIFGLCLATAGILSVYPLFWSLPTAVLGGMAAVAGIALINSLANLAGFAGPWIVGVMKEWTGSTNYAILMLAVVLIAAAGLVALVPVPGQKAKDSSQS
ncbi:MFS transporter [Herbaspirillum lusitanum]|uniref:MFS transporter n=1 Tax=Herbaspirillum lusitanum TaxID=213312 RepID=A0ABW9AF53_9BURK